MKNFIINCAEFVGDTFMWLLGTVLLTCLIMVVFVVFFTLLVLDMTIINIVRAISNQESVLDSMTEELEFWGETAKAFFGHYFAGEES